MKLHDRVQYAEILPSSRAFPFDMIPGRRRPRASEPLHWHDSFEISYVHAGRGAYELEGTACPVREGDVIFIAGPVRHRLVSEGSSGAQASTMRFSSELVCPHDAARREYAFIRRTICDRSGYAVTSPLSTAEREKVEEIIRSIIREYRQKRTWFELMIKSRLLTLVTVLLRTPVFSNAIERAVTDGVGSEPRRLADIVRFVNANYSGNINLDAVAGRFDMNPSYFSDYFHSSLGLTFTSYLARVRIRAALAMISNDRMTISKIATDCGFGTTSSFYRAFRRHVGGRPRSGSPMSGSYASTSTPDQPEPKI